MSGIGFVSLGGLFQFRFDKKITQIIAWASISNKWIIIEAFFATFHCSKDWKVLFNYIVNICLIEIGIVGG